MRIVEMVWEDLKPSDPITAGSIDNAVTQRGGAQTDATGEPELH
jgi:hypothetical protein